MKASVLISSSEHPIFNSLVQWAIEKNGDVDIFHEEKLLKGGDILFLVSFGKIVSRDVRKLFNHTLCIHASDLPYGKGWSPYIWQIVHGKDEIPVSIFEVNDKVDAGAILAKKSFFLEGHELYDEINEKLFKVSFDLMDLAMRGGPFKFIPQDGESSYLRKRSPEDSRIDPDKSISDQFNLIRTADPDRYPNFFDYKNHRYILNVQKKGDLCIA